MTPRCDVIVVAWNKLEYTTRCLESILRHTTVPIRLLVVDNGSTDGTPAFLHALAQREPGRLVVLRQPDNLGWVTGSNVGLRQANAPFACLLNNDLVVLPGWLEQMLAVAERDPQIGLMNPTYNRHDETLEAFERRALQPANDGPAYLEVNECNGACLFIRRAVIDAIGVLDEAYGSGGKDDTDYSRRAQVAGFRCARARQAFVFHWENVTTDTVPGYWTTIRQANEALFAQRWGARKQLAVVLSPDSDAQCARTLEECLALARVGVRIHVIGLVPQGSPLAHPDGRWRAGLVEHNNLKWEIHAAGALPLVNALWLGWIGMIAAMKACGRRTKDATHHFQAFIVAPRWLQGWISALGWLHGAPVCDAFETCPIVHQERRWIRHDQSPHAESAGCTTKDHR